MDVRATIRIMKAYVHARIGKQEGAILDLLRRSTGLSDSELIRRGLALVLREHGAAPSALELAGKSVGRIRKGPKDLSTNKEHLEGFGE